MAAISPSAPTRAADMDRGASTLLVEGDGWPNRHVVQVHTEPKSLPQVAVLGGHPRHDRKDEDLQLPYCWYCRCLYCLNCDRKGPEHVPLMVSALDCGIVYFFWLAGMYQPHGKFRRHLWGCLERRIQVPVGSSRHGARSVEFSFKSAFRDNVHPKVRIYEPIERGNVERPGTKRQVILYFHGGGGVIGDISDRVTHDVCCKLSARGKYVVVSAGYRKAPEDPFPAAVFDAYDALRWLACGPKDFPVADVDFSNLILAGDSSGANLCLVLSTLARDRLGPDLQPIPQAEPVITISHQVLFFPILFAQYLIKVDQPVKPADMPIIPRPVLDFFRQAYVPGHTREDVDRLSREDRRLCPLLAGVRGLPHTILISAGLDFLHLEHLVLLQEFMRRGVDIDYHYFPEEPHAFVNFGMLRPASNECIDIVLHKLREPYGGENRGTENKGASPVSMSVEDTTSRTVTHANVAMPPGNPAAAIEDVEEKDEDGSWHRVPEKAGAGIPDTGNGEVIQALKNTQHHHDHDEDGDEERKDDEAEDERPPRHSTNSSHHHVSRTSLRTRSSSLEDMLRLGSFSGHT